MPETFEHIVERLIDGEEVELSGFAFKVFSGKYVQTITDDGENYYEPQDYFDYTSDSDIFFISLDSVCRNGLLSIRVNDIEEWHHG